MECDHIVNELQDVAPHSSPSFHEFAASFSPHSLSSSTPRRSEKSTWPHWPPPWPGGAAGASCIWDLLNSSMFLVCSCATCGTCSNLSRTSNNIIYSIQCRACKNIYVGLRFWLLGLLRYGCHFCPTCCPADSSLGGVDAARDGVLGAFDDGFSICIADRTHPIRKS